MKLTFLLLALCLVLGAWAAEKKGNGKKQSSEYPAGMVIKGSVCDPKEERDNNCAVLCKEKSDKDKESVWIHTKCVNGECECRRDKVWSGILKSPKRE